MTDRLDQPVWPLMPPTPPMEHSSGQGPSVSFVVCAYTEARFEQALRCVRSALDGTRPPEEVLLVVDNNPCLRDRFVKELPGEVIVIDNEGRGLSAGRNTGLRHARSEVVAFVDDDAWPERDCLEHLLRPFANPRVIGVGGRIVPEWEQPKRGLPEELYWVVGSTYRGHRTDAGPITRPIGANMAARREAILSLGGFSYGFGRNGTSGSNEEIALFTAVSRTFGADSIWYVPDAVVHHFAPEARCTLRYLLKRSVVEGTTKADVRHLHGTDSMAHDRGYVIHSLLPGIGRYLVDATLRRERRALAHAGTLVLCFAATAAAYVAQLMQQQLRKALPALSSRQASIVQE